METNARRMKPKIPIIRLRFVACVLSSWAPSPFRNNRADKGGATKIRLQVLMQDDVGINQMQRTKRDERFFRHRIEGADINLIRLAEDTDDSS